MEKYTLEEIVNERIREYDEVDRLIKEFNDLVETVDDRYKFAFVRAFICCRDKEIGLYFNDANKLKNSIHRFKNALQIGELPNKCLMPPNYVIINDIDELQEEYKDEDGKAVLHIKDVAKFKEMHNALYESDVCKELLSVRVKGQNITDSDDKIVNFELDEAFISFSNRYSALRLVNNKWIILDGHKYNAPKILENFKSYEYDGRELSDYFKENIEANRSNNYSIALNDRYIAKPYRPGLRGCTEEGFEISKDEQSKKIILTKTRHY